MTVSLSRYALVSASIGLVASLVFAPQANGQTTPTPSPLEQQKQADEQHLDGLEGEITSIVERIPQIEENIKRTEAKKTETEQTIANLTHQANLLVPVIEQKQADYQRKFRALKEALNLDYKNGDHSTIELLAEKGSLSQALASSSYLGAFERKIDTLAQAAKQARDDLQDQKQSLDNQRSTQELLQRQLTSLAEGVTQQRAELEELLANRQNEATYIAERIATAKKIQEMLLTGGNAIWGTFTEGAHVKQGDVLGYEGSTGFSTGCHTHFSVIAKGHWVNPDAYWPVLKKPIGSIFQLFGWTDWAKRGVYHGNIHNGIDFVQGCGSPVRSAADGVIIRDNRTDGSGFGHYIMVRHPDGLITLYAHLI